MKLKLLRWQLAGFAVTVLGGVLLHFLYNWMQRVGTVSDEGAGHE